MHSQIHINNDVSVTNAVIDPSWNAKYYKKDQIQLFILTSMHV